jgi:DNA-binding GntR family transcriptional regulator
MQIRDVTSSFTIPKTLSQSIYSHLKDAILNNHLKANQKINEKEIAQSFGTSTTPVREAVMRLSAEGFVITDSHRETIVKGISFTELREIFPIMGHLDSLCFTSVVDNLSPKTLGKIETYTKEMESSCRTNASEKFIELDQRIHTTIWDSIPNTFLKATIHSVNEQLLRYKAVGIHALKKPEALKSLLEDHRLILKALKDKDRQKLKSLSLKHWDLLLRSSVFEDGLKDYFTAHLKEAPSAERKKKGVER